MDEPVLVEKQKIEKVEPKTPEPKIEPKIQKTPMKPKIEKREIQDDYFDTEILLIGGILSAIFSIFKIK